MREGRGARLPRLGLAGRAVLLAALSAPIGAAAAQQEGAVDEAQLLREAGVREAAGELARAEAVLKRILASRPASIPALLSLERILRVQNRMAELPPLVASAVAEEPRSALLNQLLVRTYSALDRVADIEVAAAAWIRAVPDLEIPYREVARVWESRGEYDRARRLLEQGRQRIGRPDALALELGDIYAALDAPERAVREWERAVGAEARGLNQVRRRLRSLPDAGAAVLPQLVELLTAEPTTRARRQAAVDLAVDAGLEARAETLARHVLAELPAAERQGFLIDVARRADGARLHRLGYWAYGALAASESEDGRLLAIRNRLAELALELGDTAGAAANYEAVEAAYEAGTPQRRQAAALRIQLMAQHGDVEAGAALQEFRAEYPDAPENDRLTGVTAEALLERGRTAEAEALLAGVRGAHSALLRGRIALERGDAQAARLAYMAAAPDLRGREATRVLSLVTLLGRVSDEAGKALGAAMRLQDREPGGAAVDLLESGVPRFRAEDRPPVLDFAAGLAEEAGLADEARRIRRRIVEDFPRSGEAPAALLALARSLRSEDGATREARELLERLIIEYPRSALIPQARRELQQLQGGGSAEYTGSRTSKGAA